MKRTYIFVFIFAISLTGISLGEENRAESEKQAIESILLDYVEGYWEGDVERMEQALHPDLVKRSVISLPETGRNLMEQLFASSMVEITRMNKGKLSNVPLDDLKIKVSVLDVFKNVASAVVTSSEYFDYIHLVKWNGRWKIVNIMWTRTKPE
jgi:hypothetical protein